MTSMDLSETPGKEKLTLNLSSLKNIEIGSTDKPRFIIGNNLSKENIQYLAIGFIVGIVLALLIF